MDVTGLSNDQRDRVNLAKEMYSEAEKAKLMESLMSEYMGDSQPTMGMRPGSSPSQMPINPRDPKGSTPNLSAVPRPAPGQFPTGPATKFPEMDPSLVHDNVGRGMVPFGGGNSAQALMDQLKRSRTSSPGIDKNGKRINYGRR